MELTSWPPAHSDALRDYLALGMSYSEIARAINAKFNTHYSRSAMIGRARRIGLARSQQPGEAARLSGKSQQVSLQRLCERYAANLRWPVPVFQPVELPPLRCAAVEPRGLTLMELEPGQCRYPYGGDREGEAITFCGHPQREDSSYCPAHFDLTRVPSESRGGVEASPQAVEVA